MNDITSKNELRYLPHFSIDYSRFSKQYFILLQHLQNIRTLLDASVALMNQYSALVARLPPVSAPVDATASTSQSSASAVTAADFATLLNPPATLSTPNLPEDNAPQPKIVSTVAAQLEDLGSDDDSITKLNKEPLPSTGDAFLITPDQQQQAVPSTSAAPNSSSKSRNSNDAKHAESSEMSEIRRRRLEKFGSRTNSD